MKGRGLIYGACLPFLTFFPLHGSPVLPHTPFSFHLLTFFPPYHFLFPNFITEITYTSLQIEVLLNP